MILLKKGLRYRINSMKGYSFFSLIMAIIFLTIVSLIFLIVFLKINYINYAIIVGIAYIIVMIILIASYLWDRRIFNENLKELDKLQNGTDKEKMEELEYLINKNRKK